MKSTELRIGNLIQTEKYGVKIEVKAIFGKYGLECGNSGNDYDDYSPDIKDVKPIPLTEEWLIKFGFESDNYTDEDRTPIYYIDKNGFNITFEYSKECFLESIGIDIEHVHTLQNLYFALTNEELTIKEL